MITKINYRIHTDAVKEYLIPGELSAQKVNQLYASEADVLNMSLFGKTAKQWQDENPGKEGNIRDYANVNQLVCLANLENLNAVWIEKGQPPPGRLQRLNQVAIQQMELLTQDVSAKRLKGGRILASFSETGIPISS